MSITLVNGHASSYDPCDLRRMHYQSASLLAHPPVPIDELAQHIERLKAHDNAKFSLEYESIDPGQLFKWEYAINDHNRLKNRYANVIAYDHSRVTLSKLPPEVFQQQQQNGYYPYHNHA